MESTLSKSSQGLKEFLEETNLSKKELAHLVGVSASYIYNLIDGRIRFTTKKDTLERLAVVMDIDPNEFEEYKSSYINPYNTDNSARFEFLEIRSKYTMSNLDLVKKVPTELQLKVVDILRGESNIPPDITFIEMLLKLLNNRVSSSDCLVILQAAVLDAFKQAGTVINADNFNMIKYMVNSYIEGR